MVTPKRLIIITDQKLIQKYQFYIRENTIIIGWNPTVCEKLSSRNILFKKPTDFYQYNYHDGVAWIKNLSQIDFLNGSNLNTIFAYKNTSLWWWMESWLYTTGYNFGYSVEEIIKTFNPIYNIVLIEKPDEIIIITQGSLIDKIIILVANQLNIRLVKSIDYFNTIPLDLSQKLRLIYIKEYFNCRFLIRKLLWNTLLFYNKKEKLSISQKPLLFIYFTNERNKLYVEPILQQFKDNKYLLSAIDVNGTNPDIFNIKRLNEKIRDKAVQHLLLENFISKADLINIKKDYNNLKKKWDSFQRDPLFLKQFILNGINLYPLFYPQFSAYFDVRLMNHLVEFTAAENAIKIISPKAVISQVETSSIDKCFFVACKKNNIPTFAIQHGNISEDIRLIHQKHEISIRKISPHYCPIPDVTAVYGKLDQEFLIKEGNYPPKSIIITGNPRYDCLINVNKEFNKNDICSELNLDPNKKIFLFAAEPFSNLADKVILFETICKAFIAFKELQLIVKIHPLETMDFYTKIITKYNLNAKVTNTDVFKLLFVSDALLVKSSAVGLEAAILNKPIIMINLTNESGYADYAKEKIAFGVYTPKNLSLAISQIINNKNLLKRLAKNRKKYIFNHCYRVDGKSSARIALIIRRTIGG